jgi:AcrR family transcriptional regulator
MPRTKQQNELIRENTRQKILDTSLSLYVRYGYAGTVMDQIAKDAGIAKGLLYYYYKTKNMLFKDLFNKMIEEISILNKKFHESLTDESPVKKLVLYTISMFGMSIKDPRKIQFAMRMPFDAYAVFGPEGWKNGLVGSEIHNRSLEKIIAEGISEGLMKCSDVTSAASSFWTVYVAGLFSYTRMMSGKGNDISVNFDDLEKILSFGMAGLKIEEEIWKKELNRANTSKVFTRNGG